ncbi:alpha/beta fold hydrolase [Andreprevotia chitinilytica]|uniref:alpha/beta fold hydrolase n=1 Tax=Andreprevotia chitinilytica TaxID=396808 RepID=UPI00054D8946|nr:alpha/beta hydrolase [Andreprevotia chitinilytica]
MLVTLLRRLLKTCLTLLVIVLLLVVGTLAGFRFAAQLRETGERHVVAPSSGSWVQAADVEMFVQEAGPANGQPVLFIHGTGAWSETWRPTMTALAAAGYHAIAIDLPPFGYSQRPANGDYSTEAQAKRIVGVLDSLGVKQTVLVGHSFGGRATVQAVMDAPQRFKALALVDAALGLQPAPETGASKAINIALQIGPLRNAVIATTATNPLLTSWVLEQFTSRHEVLTPARVAIYQKPFSYADTTEAFGDWALAFATGQPSGASNPAAYHALALPTLLLWGKTDAVTPLSQGEFIATLLPHAQLTVLDDVGHIPQIEDNDAFNAALLGFLRKRAPAL